MLDMIYDYEDIFTNIAQTMGRKNVDVSALTCIRLLSKEPITGEAIKTNLENLILAYDKVTKNLELPYEMPTK